MDNTINQKICLICQQEKPIDDFYHCTRYIFYPNIPDKEYITNECKECILKKQNMLDPTTFIPYLRELEIPYIKKIWDEMILEYSNTEILQEYISKMQTAEFSKYRFKDGEWLNQKYSGQNNDI